MVTMEPLFDQSPGMSLGEAAILDKYHLVSQQEHDGLTSVIYVSKSGVPELTTEMVEVLHHDIQQGLALGKKIDSRSSLEYSIKVAPHSVGFITTDGTVNPDFLSDTPEARSAAVLHEMVHTLEEDTGICLNDNNESLPNLAEFLFTKGGTRLGYFRHLYELSFDSQTDDLYHLAMRDIRQFFGDESTTPTDDGYRAMRQKVKAMSEDDKVEAIRGVIRRLEK